MIGGPYISTYRKNPWPSSKTRSAPSLEAIIRSFSCSALDDGAWAFRQNAGVWRAIRELHANQFRGCQNRQENVYLLTIETAAQ